MQALHIYLPATVFSSSHWRGEDAARVIACLDYGSVFRDALLEEMARAIFLELDHATPDGPPLFEALLAEDTLCLAQVARACGFSTQASFNKAFARATGQCPGQYRRTRVEGSGAERGRRSKKNNHNRRYGQSIRCYGQLGLRRCAVLLSCAVARRTAFNPCCNATHQLREFIYGYA